MEATEFDSSLGGAEQLPHIANSFKFAASRSVEIAAMTESILKPNKTKLIFQTLPVHMRRRVMSHNCKRLPRRLREGHLEQLKKSGLPPKHKRPSRKYRRRPANLLEEYTRRQRRISWLETHIWHAKRFHMIERWGFRLAYRPCDKAFRACYRATSAHCLIQDISYYVPIQIKGSVESIKTLFENITSKCCGLTVAAKSYINGNRSGVLNVFKPNTYPYEYVGTIEFLWIKISLKPELLIFVHPSQSKQIEAIFSDLITSRVTTVDSKRLKLTNDLSNVQINVLNGQFNRFRLSGPKSHAVLTHSLKCVTDLNKISSNEWIAHLSKENTNYYLEEKENYWDNITNLSSPSQFPSRIVIGLIVKDPRWSRPQKRTKAVTEPSEVNSSILAQCPDFASTSPLWRSDIREIIKKNVITNAKFIEHVTKTQLIPGETNEDDPSLQSIPIILMQRPGSQNSYYKKIGFGSGWDIIIPSGYSLPFWLMFIMFGARAGGLRETEHLAHEMGECYFPPDSESGIEEEKRKEVQLKEQYFKRPPSKRVNFTKLGISSPFICPWKVLLKDWSEVPINEFFVLRDKMVINDLQDSLSKKRNLNPIKNGNTCLVAIYLQIVGKGILKDHALICLPNKEDLSSVTLSEPHHEDHNVKVRKEKRLEHRKILKKLRRMRKKLRKKSSMEPKKQPKSKEPSEYIKSMQELWVPSNINSVRNTCVRQTMGYVTKGAFSYTEAKSCGVGYISYNALTHLLKTNINRVLVRNITSKKYRIASIQLINNF